MHARLLTARCRIRDHRLVNGRQSLAILDRTPECLTTHGELFTEVYCGNLSVILAALCSGMQTTFTRSVFLR